MFVVQFVLLSVAVFCCGTASTDVYNEELTLTPLNRRQFLATFSFRVKATLSREHAHFDLFPKVIGELIQNYHVDEFHLSLTQGFWRANRWGLPPYPSAPTGAQLWALFNSSLNDTSVTLVWRNFVHAMSGLFCASLTQLDRVLTVSPEFAFRPEGVALIDTANAFPHTLRYAALPTENVCTENLTPWKKLLPCKMDAGLAALLNPLRLYSSQFHSMAVDLRTVCPPASSECAPANAQHELLLTLNVVLEPPGIENEWRLLTLFGAQVARSCSIATTSVVRVVLPTTVHVAQNASGDSAASSGGQTAVFTPPPTLLRPIDGKSRQLVTFDVSAFFARPTVGERPFNLGVKFSGSGESVCIRATNVSLSSYVGGTGLQDGQLVSLLANNGARPLVVLYSQLVPWYLRVFFHTLRVRCERTGDIEPLLRVVQPPRARERPAYFELALRLPAGEQCRLSIDFERALLRWTECPPDSHRGFSIPAASLTWCDDDGDDSCASAERADSLYRAPRGEVRRLFGEVLLVSLPMPDFSMPYNVICLVCTVVALAFGPIHTLTTKTLQVVPVGSDVKEPLARRLLAPFRRQPSWFRAFSRVDSSRASQAGGGSLLQRGASVLFGRFLSKEDRQQSVTPSPKPSLAGVLDYLWQDSLLHDTLEEEQAATPKRKSSVMPGMRTVPETD